MEQFEQEEIVVELDERGGRRVAKSRIGVLGEGRELGAVHVVADEGRDQARRRLARRARPASARISPGVDRGGVSGV